MNLRNEVIEGALRLQNLFDMECGENALIDVTQSVSMDCVIIKFKKLMI